MSKKRLNINDKFNRLTVIALGKPGSRKVSCFCDCGNKVEVFTFNLKSGHSKSCGCLNLEVAKNRQLKHGHSFQRSDNKRETRTYRSWQLMKRRCLNPNDASYIYYGGRGITICEQWVNSYEQFFCDMGECPIGHSLDRINTEGNYELNNCRWANSETQANNKRSNRLITYEGETKTLAQWCKVLGLSYTVLSTRLNKHGWTVEKAFNQSVRRRNND